jgi:hypothetical protein
MATARANRMTLDALREARRRFQEIEPRDLFYRAALSLIRLSERPDRDLDLAESLAVLLQTWNRQYYRFQRGFREEHLVAIQQLLARYADELRALRGRWLTSYDERDAGVISRLFHDFEVALGPVGAAKALHLLAPTFFPLWDQTIAHRAYGIYLKNIGLNADHYLKLMKLTKEQIAMLGGWDAFGDANPVKAIDEYNYCVYTRGLDIVAS